MTLSVIIQIALILSLEDDAALHHELTRAICDTEPTPPSRVALATAPALTRAQRRQLRGDLDAVVMMTLRKDPARRYANATELGEDIFRHRESLPVRARRGATRRIPFSSPPTTSSSHTLPTPVSDRTTRPGTEGEAPNP